MNFLIRQFRINLVNYINSVQEIPIEVKRLILAEVLKMVEDKANAICDEEENNIREKSQNGLSESEPGILNPIVTEGSND